MQGTNGKAVSRGFTLIEFLVVLAIIVVLAAILFPVFASAREKARQATCASNERQLGLAFIQYVQDYDDTFPCGVYLPWGRGALLDGWGWAGLIYPYVKSPGAYDCPDDLRLSRYMRPGQSPISYVYNFNLAGLRILKQGTGVSGSLPIATLNRVSDPAVTVVLSEVVGPTVDFSSPVPETESFVTNGIGPSICGNIGGRLSTLTRPEIIRHGNGTNYLAADGHVNSFVQSRYQVGQTSLSSSGSAICPQDGSSPSCRDSFGVDIAAGSNGLGSQFVMTFGYT